MKWCGLDRPANPDLSLSIQSLPRFEILNLNSNRATKVDKSRGLQFNRVAVKEGLRYINLCINAHSPHSDISLVTAP